MEKEIIQNQVKKVFTFKIRVSWKNGSNETIFAKTPPNVNPVTPMFMDFHIKNGHMRHINMTEVRDLDIEVEQDNTSNIIT